MNNQYWQHRKQQIKETWNNRDVNKSVDNFFDKIIEQEKAMLAESEKAKAELLEALKECNISICCLCRYINNQHEKCNNCDDKEYRDNLIQKHQETN